MGQRGPPKGVPRTPGSGRKKGTPNRKTLDAAAKAEQLGVDPFEILCLFAKGDWKGLGYESATQTLYAAGGFPYEVPIITPDHRLIAAREAAQYLLPKRKAIEHSGPSGGSIPIDGKASFVLRWNDDDNSGNAPPNPPTSSGGPV